MERVVVVVVFVDAGIVFFVDFEVVHLVEVVVNVVMLVSNVANILYFSTPFQPLGNHCSSI